MNTKKVECLLLSEPDLLDLGVLDMKQCVKTMEEVFHLYGQGDFLMPGPYERDHGAMIQFPMEKRIYNMPVETPDRRYVAMIGYLGGRFHVCGGKLYGSNIENRAKGLPRSILTTFLSDVDTGAPLAIMSGNLISSVRTGAIPGVAAKYMQSESASTVGIVGAGVISRSCLLSICETMTNKKQALVYDIVEENALRFCQEMSQLIDIDIRPASSLEEMVRQSDIISCASSGKTPAHIKSTWLKDGACIMLIGASMLDEELLTDPNTKLVIDSHKMHEIWLNDAIERTGSIESAEGLYPSYQYIKLLYDGKIPKNACVELGDVVTGKVKGRENNKHKSVFISGGLSLEDIAWTYEMYQRALREGKGTRFTFFDEAHWK